MNIWLQVHNMMKHNSNVFTNIRSRKWHSRNPNIQVGDELGTNTANGRPGYKKGANINDRTCFSLSTSSYSFGNMRLGKISEMHYSKIFLQHIIIWWIDNKDPFIFQGIRFNYTDQSAEGSPVHCAHVYFWEPRYPDLKNEAFLILSFW